MNSKLLGGLMNKRPAIYTGIIILMLGLFEAINYSSSYQAMMLILGIENWARFIAFGFVAVDFAGLAKMVSKEAADMVDAMWYLFAAWFLTAMGDTFLTYYASAYSIAQRPQHTLVAAGVISPWAWQHGTSMVFASVMFLIQIALVTTLNKAASTEGD